MTSATTSAAPVVELTGVSVSFGQSPAAATTVLVDVDLRIGAGERVALVGASGAGKTTLLAVLSGLVQPSAGSVSVLGLDPGRINGRALRAHRSRLGVVSQHLDMALPLRVIHNVNAGRLGRWSTASSLWSLLRPAGRVEATQVLDRVGLADRLLTTTDTLSGGERQRVAVARVLRQQPDLVLADEPTSSVDPRLADEVMGLLCGSTNTPSGWTTVVSVHEPALARRHADRMVGLRGGRIVFDRSPNHVSDADLVDLYRAGSACSHLPGG